MNFLLNVCQNPDILRIVYFIIKILDIVFIAVPIALIVMLTIDVFKMIIGDEKDVKQSQKMVINRIIFAIAMFFVPTIVSLVFNIISVSGINVNTNYMTCFTNANKESINAYQNTQDQIEAEEEEERRQEIINNNSQGNTSSGNNSGNDGSNNNSGSTGTESSGDLYTDLADEMIRIANDQIGNNGDVYGSNGQPWCAIFVNWVAKNTEIDGTNLLNDIIYKEGKNIYPNSAVNSIYIFDNHSNLNFYYSNAYGGNYTPKKGDYIYFDWGKDWDKNIYSTMFGEGDHIGIVEYVKDGYVYTIEGNTNGGIVSKLNYNLDSKSIMGYGSWYK